MKNEGGERVGREYGEKGVRDGEVTCLEVWGSLHGCMLDIMEVAPPKSTLITFPFFLSYLILGRDFGLGGRG